MDSHLPRHLVLVDELSTVAECLSTPFLWKELRVHSHIAFKDPVPVTKKIDKMQLDLEDTDILDVEDLNHAPKSSSVICEVSWKHTVYTETCIFHTSPVGVIG